MERKILRRDEVKKIDNNATIDGVLFAGATLTPVFLTEEWHNFEFAKEDVLIVTYPKSGTNWMIEILSLIHCRGDPKWVQSEIIYNRSPWIEVDELYTILKKNKCSPFISSHLPIQFMPESFFRSKTKVIYVIRNPKDIIASGYFFWKGLSFVQKAESMDQYFDWFMKGNVPYGSWFDHVHGWLSMREHDNFLLLSYEELKRDLRNTVKKISQFLGVELGQEAIESVLKNCSFQAMKNNNMSNYSFVDDSIMNTKEFPMIRKGVTGDWKNHLTVAQAETFDKVYQEKMKDLPSELFPWD